jgi:hypothetical protein
MPFDPILALGTVPPSHLARLRYLPEADRTVLDSVRLGVIFIMAFWSGPARMAFAHLKRVLSVEDPSGKLELVVIDTDGCSDLYESQEVAGRFHGGGLSGAGETAWVLNGRVLNTSIFGAESGTFESFTRNLLDQAPSG